MCMKPRNFRRKRLGLGRIVDRVKLNPFLIYIYIYILYLVQTFFFLFFFFLLFFVSLPSLVILSITIRDNKRKKVFFCFFALKKNTKKSLGPDSALKIMVCACPFLRLRQSLARACCYYFRFAFLRSTQVKNKWYTVQIQSS